MPIQFRCTTCNKLLSIARRKGGQIIECPVCGASIRAPEEFLPHPNQHPEAKITQSPQSFVPSKPPISEQPSTAEEISPHLAKSVAPASALSPTALTQQIPPIEPEFHQLKEPAQTAINNITAPTVSKSQGQTSSILELDPDTLFGSKRNTIPKASSYPQPGILEEMYTQPPNPTDNNTAEQIDDIFAPELAGEKPTNSSWKLIVFGILMIFGFLVAAFLAWKLVFSTPS